MPPRLLTLIGITIMAVAVWGLFSGKIIAGARGLKNNYYYRDDNPISFYSFIFIYLCIGAFLLLQS